MTFNKIGSKSKGQRFAINLVLLLKKSQDGTVMKNCLSSLDHPQSTKYKLNCY